MQTFLEIGLSNAAMAAVLALLASGVGLFCRRPAVRHTLWLLVLLKLVTPPMLVIPVAFPPVVEAVLPGQNGARLAPSPSAFESGNLRQPATHDLAGQGEEDPLLHNSDPSPAAADRTPCCSLSDEEGASSESTPVSNSAISALSPLIFIVWLTGAVSWFAVAGTRIYRFHRLLRYGRVAPAPLQDQTRLLAERLGLARCPTVWLVPGRVSPLLWALGRKLRVVAPSDLLDRLGPEQRATLLAHELAHARRRDHWVRWLEFIVGGFYWWLPVAWWARRQLQQAEEECCDAWVVWTLPTAAKAYAKVLLQTVDFLDARLALPPVASGVGHVHLLKRRLTMIVRQPLCPCLPWPVHLGVIVLCLLVLPFAPQRLAAQASEDKLAPELSRNTELARAEQDPADRDLERRLRTLEEKMDRLMQKLEAQRGEKSEGRPSTEDRAGAAEAKAKAKEMAEKAREKARAAAAEAKARAKEMAEKARERVKEERKKEFTRRPDEIDGKGITSEQVERLMKELQEKVNKELDPARMKELQRRIEETVNKSQRKVEEALKKSTAELERTKQRLLQAEQRRASEPRQERSSDQEQRNLERRMDRLEQKMDRVLQALEKSGKQVY